MKRTNKILAILNNSRFVLPLASAAMMVGCGAAEPARVDSDSLRVSRGTSNASASDTESLKHRKATVRHIDTSGCSWNVVPVGEGSPTATVLFARQFTADEMSQMPACSIGLEMTVPEGQQFSPRIIVRSWGSSRLIRTYRFVGDGRSYTFDNQIPNGGDPAVLCSRQGDECAACRRDASMDCAVHVEPTDDLYSPSCGTNGTVTLELTLEAVRNGNDSDAIFQVDSFDIATEEGLLQEIENKGSVEWKSCTSGPSQPTIVTEDGAMCDNVTLLCDARIGLVCEENVNVTLPSYCRDTRISSRYGQVVGLGEDCNGIYSIKCGEGLACSAKPEYGNKLGVCRPGNL